MVNARGRCDDVWGVRPLLRHHRIASRAAALAAATAAVTALSGAVPARDLPPAAGGFGAASSSASQPRVASGMSLFCSMHRQDTQP